MKETDLCNCGSGLRKLRCCEADPTSFPAAASLELINPQAIDATRLFNEKKLREAEALALKILDLAPNQRMALRVLYEIRRSENQPRAVEALARRLATLPAENPAQASAANLQLAQLLVGQNRHAEAEAPARAAVKHTPRDANAHHVLGVVFTETGKLAEGEQHYRQAMALRGQEDGLMTGNLAWNLRQQGLLAESSRLYNIALAARPDNRRATGGFAQVETALGNFGHAAELLDGALAATNDRSLRLLRAMLDIRREHFQAVLDRINDAPDALLPAEHILRGQALQRLDRLPEAIAAYATARQLQRERFGHRYQPAEFQTRAEQYKSFFTSDKLSALPRAPAPSLMPVFLLGFPGSGTTLLEQLLAQIPGIAAGDEFAPIARLLEAPELANYPDCLTEMLVGQGQHLPARLAARYLQQLRDAGFTTGDQKFVTLRSPGDAWHLGLIKLLFPEAPIIHLLRHPLDIVTNNFARDKKLEANCTVSLPALAQHYDLTMQLIRHYRGQLTLRYLPIRYENLVTAPHAVLADVQAFIGATAATPPEPVLRANRLQTLRRHPGHSAGQQPIHSRGVYEHLAFEAAAPNLFAETRPILAPWITELGYAA